MNRKTRTDSVRYNQFLQDKKRKYHEGRDAKSVVEDIENLILYFQAHDKFTAYELELLVKRVKNHNNLDD